MGNIPAAVAEGAQMATGATAVHAATERSLPVSILSRLADRTRSFLPAHEATTSSYTLAVSDIFLWRDATPLFTVAYSNTASRS